MLPHDTAAVIWYIILAVAWCVYLLLESFMVGSGMLQRFGNSPAKQRSIQLSGGLHYDGIEVWLVTALGGTFAAFPPVYAVILESLYIPFFLLITALILRIISIEFMYKDDSLVWQKRMSRIWGISSFLIPLVLGVYFANFFRGFALDQNGYHGSIFSLFDLIGLAGGVFFVANACITGSSWIRLTTIRENQTENLGDTISFFAAITEILMLVILFLGLNNKSTLFTAGLYAVKPVLWILPVLAVLASLGTFFAVRGQKTGLSFIGGLATMLLTMVSFFAAAFPAMVRSSLDPAFGIDVFTGSSSQVTLNVMTYVALVFVPLVIFYQTWKFAYFRKDKNEV